MKRINIIGAPRLHNWIWYMSKKVNFPARTATPLALKRLTIDLEAAQHRRFKTVCAQHGLKMADELRRLIEMRIAEIEHRQGT
jgi:hypothetical protein